MPRKGQRKAKSPIGDASDPHGFAVLSRDYAEWLAARNYSPTTIASRAHHLREFQKWADERGLSRPVEVTKPILERYQRHLFHYRRKNGQPLSFRSQHGALVPVRAFFKWLCRQNLLLSNPASDLDLPRLEKRLPKHVLTAGETERVLGIPDTSDALGLRDRAILEVFYSTGMRRMELAHLKLYDLDQERGTLTVRQGKGKKDRMIPIGERAIAWINRYLDDARSKLALTPDDGTIFLTNVGDAFELNRLTQLARHYVDAAEIGKRGSCHLFR
ncbi:MAG: tyrosine-type recombinase/integrase, partial [Opitutaceae bacterium]